MRSGQSRPGRNARSAVLARGCDGSRCGNVWRRRKTVGWASESRLEQRALPLRRSFEIIHRGSLLRWQAKACLVLLLREASIGTETSILADDGFDALSATLQLPVEIVDVGVRHWIKKGTLVMTGTSIHMPNYVTAQECSKSDALRAQEYRERKRDVTKRDESSQNVTPESQKVTDPSRVVTERHAASRGVTPHDPIRSDPNHTTHPAPLPPGGGLSGDPLPASASKKREPAQRGTRV